MTNIKLLITEHKASIGFLLSLCLLFSFSFVTARIDTNDISDVFKVNDIVSYTKPCMNNGTYCSASAVCNYTFYDRDSSIRINNALATQVGVDGASNWQYNISHDDTGYYKVDMVCLDDGLKGSETLYYEVTGSGVTDTSGFYIIILIISFGLIILGFSMSDAILTIFGSFGLYFVSLYTLFNGIAGIKDATTTWAVGLILLGMAMYMSIRSAYELIKD